MWRRLCVEEQRPFFLLLTRHPFLTHTHTQADACKRVPPALAPVVTLARAMLRELGDQVREREKKN